MARRTSITVLRAPYSSILSSKRTWGLPSQGHPAWRNRLPHTYTLHFSSSTHDSGKPIVLEKPDKFRPPSHPARLNARRIPRHYPGPPIQEAEKEAQAKRRYPHTFPNKGTRMHWFLTNKYIHLWISLGTLFTLACITTIQSFLHTSPFGHLTPSISTLPTSPISFFRDWISVLRMHQQYRTEQTAESRHRGIADAQKRRLYRRAHGMEDLDKEGAGEGIDVRGLVRWDDGLTRGERERMQAAARGAGAGDSAIGGENDTIPVEGRESSEEEQSRAAAAAAAAEPRRNRRPLKKWLGIW